MLWLSFSFRPLRLIELCETLAFDESDTTLDESGRLWDTRDLLRWCQGLITHHPETSIITLSHSSVRTYLLSNQVKDGPASFFSINKTDAERLLLRKCLTYMMFRDFGKGYRSTYDEWSAFSERWPLLNYASLADLIKKSLYAKTDPNGETAAAHIDDSLLLSGYGGRTKGIVFPLENTISYVPNLFIKQTFALSISFPSSDI